MNPDIQNVLEDHAKRLLEVIAPKLTGFDANGVTMMAFMLNMVAEEYDRGAARLVEENSAIRQLLLQAEPLVAADLAAKMTQLGREGDDDLHIRALQTSNDLLRAALSRLHAHLEELSSPAARLLEDAIWSELRRSVQRRRVGLANF